MKRVDLLYRNGNSQAVSLTVDEQLPDVLIVPETGLPLRLRPKIMPGPGQVRYFERCHPDQDLYREITP